MYTLGCWRIRRIHLTYEMEKKKSMSDYFLIRIQGAVMRLSEPHYGKERKRRNKTVVSQRMQCGRCFASAQCVAGIMLNMIIRRHSMCLSLELRKRKNGGQQRIPAAFRQTVKVKPWLPKQWAYNVHISKSVYHYALPLKANFILSYILRVFTFYFYIRRC